MRCLSGMDREKDAISAGFYLLCAPRGQVSGVLPEKTDRFALWLLSGQRACSEKQNSASLWESSEAAKQRKHRNKNIVVVLVGRKSGNLPFLPQIPCFFSTGVVCGDCGKVERGFGMLEWGKIVEWKGKTCGEIRGMCGGRKKQFRQAVEKRFHSFRGWFPQGRCGRGCFAFADPGFFSTRLFHIVLKPMWKTGFSLWKHC